MENNQYRKISRKGYHFEVESFSANIVDNYTHKTNRSFDEINKERKRKRINKRYNGLKDIAYSAPEEFRYFGTFTSGIKEERTDPKKLLHMAYEYMKCHCTGFFLIVLERNIHTCLKEENEQCDPEYHIHILSSSKIDFDEWKESHNCIEKALYFKCIEDYEKAISYVAKGMKEDDLIMFKQYRYNYKNLGHESVCMKESSDGLVVLYNGAKTKKMKDLLDIIGVSFDKGMVINIKMNMRGLGRIIIGYVNDDTESIAYNFSRLCQGKYTNCVNIQAVC